MRFRDKLLGGAKPLGWDQGIAFALDITDRKKAEGIVKATLAEKEVLLREIHHRVKNNLAVISSMLSLQSHRYANSILTEAFAQTRHRIRSMALAHEHLYRSQNLAEIDVNQYVSNVVDHLIAALPAVGIRIAVSKTIEEVSFNIDTAIPVGFILTELVSNSIKHAFPDGWGGEIGVTLRPSDEDNYELVVADNGVGLPQGIDLKNSKSLGLELATIFVKQLRGQMEITSDKGTVVRIRFKEINKG